MLSLLSIINCICWHCKCASRQATCDYLLNNTFVNDVACFAVKSEYLILLPFKLHQIGQHYQSGCVPVVRWQSWFSTQFFYSVLFYHQQTIKRYKKVKLHLKSLPQLSWIKNCAWPLSSECHYWLVQEPIVGCQHNNTLKTALCKMVILWKDKSMW